MLIPYVVVAWALGGAGVWAVLYAFGEDDAAASLEG